jgi:TPR repeat protein
MAKKIKNKENVKLYRLSAEQGLADARFYLGLFFLALLRFFSQNG